MLPGITPSWVAGVSPGYRIDRSLRFTMNSDTSLHLPAAPPRTSTAKCTTSFWVKRALRNAATASRIFDCYDGSSPTSAVILFDGNSQLVAGSGGANSTMTTVEVFHDYSRWMHVVVVFDSATPPYVFIYVDGVLARVTNNGTTNVPHQFMYPNTLNRIGDVFGNMYDGYNLDGYLAEFHHIDGQAVLPSAFGESVKGKWRAKAYSGTYGSSGFYLKFSDNSSAAALGKDYSGMSNLLPYSDAFATNWTKLNNAVVTAGQNDPFGGTGACSLAVGSSTARPKVSYSTTRAIGETTTVTVIAAGGSIQSINIFNGSVNGGMATVDLSVVGGSVTTVANIGTGTNTTARVERVGAWVKCSVTTTHNTAGADNVVFEVNSNTAINSLYITIFRASLTLGSATPAELQYAAGAAVPNKNWTPNGLGVDLSTSTYFNDSYVDTPNISGFGIDTGAGGQVRSNYAVFDPMDRGGGLIPHFSGLYVGSNVATAWDCIRTTMAVPGTGHWWCEFRCHSLPEPGHAMLGVSDASYPRQAAGYPGVDTRSVAYYCYNGNIYYNGGATSIGAAASRTGDHIGMRIDNGSIYFYRRAGGAGPWVLQGSGAASTGWTGSLAASIGLYDGYGIFVNFGQQPWATALPVAGMKGWAEHNIDYAGYPVIESVAYNSPPAGTSHVFTMPSGIVAGDLLLLLYGAQGGIFVSETAGWLSIGADSRSALYRIATGDANDNYTINTNNAASPPTGVVYRISNYVGAPESASVTSTVAGAGDPPALSPSWGAKNTLWIAQCNTSTDQASYPSIYAMPYFYSDRYRVYPSTYPTVGGPTLVSLATRRARTPTEDPSPFLGSNFTSSRSRVVAIRGTA